MKLPLNHNNNPLDKQLQDRLRDAEAMPPSFGKLFGDKSIAYPSKRSLGKWMRSSIFLFSLAGSVALGGLLQSDSTLEEGDTVFALTQKTKNTNLNKADLAESNAEIKKYAQTATDRLPHNSPRLTGEMILNKNRKKSFSSDLAKPSSGESTKIKGEAQLLASLPSDKPEPHHLFTTIQKKVYSQSEEKTNNYLKPLRVENPEPIKNKKGHWYAGLTAAVNNTWILNQNTYGEFGGYEFAYKIDWGYQYGVRLGYHPSRKGWGFELGYIPESAKGQKYEDVIQARKQHREVDLNYSQAILKLKWRQPLSQKRNGTAINWEIGGAYNQLNSAYQNNNGAWTEITERFRNHSWQVMVGSNIDVPISQSVFFSFGVQGSMSTDINARGWRAPGSYGKSHTIIFGLQTGVSYQFR